MHLQDKLILVLRSIFTTNILNSCSTKFHKREPEKLPLFSFLLIIFSKTLNNIWYNDELIHKSDSQVKTNR